MATVLIAFGVAQGLAVQAAEPPGGDGATGGGTLPNLGDSAEMSPAVERRLGDRIARELYRDPDYVDDAIIMDYVQGIWQPLLAAARLRGELAPELDEAYAWKILLGRDRTVNAFALPGAYMGLHLGLVGVVTSRDELASVLAHELSHITQRHISRLMTHQGEQTPWLMGAMVLGMLAATKNPNAANALIVTGQAAAVQTQLNFSRDMEREADRVGFGVMAQAGFAPQGFVGMFEKLQQASRLNDAGNFPYLRSHPLTTERISDMQTRVGLSPKAPSAVTDMEQAMVAARARMLSSGAVDALRAAQQEGLSAAAVARLAPTQRAAVLYAAAWSSMRLREHGVAQTLWQQLQGVTQTAVNGAGESVQRVVRLLGAELALARNDSVAARQILGPLSGSETRAELLFKAQAAGDAQRADLAQALQGWVTEQRSDASAWQALAALRAAQGRTIAAIRAEAEANVAQLDYVAALGRFKAAQDWARSNPDKVDAIELAVVDTRVRQMESLLREQAADR